MSIYDLQLCKGGVLKLLEWEKNTYVEKIIEPDEFVYFNNNTICLEKNVTMKDFYLLIDSDPDYFSLLTSCPVLQDMVEEGLSEEDSLLEEWDLLKDSCDQISFLELKRISALEEEDSDCKKYLTTYMEFSGISNKEKYALELSPLNCLSKYPLFLNEQVELFNFNSEDDEDNRKPIFTYYQKFTLQDFIKGIIDELSFMGGAENKTIMAEKIKESLEQLEKGEVKTYSFEEIKEQINRDIDKYKVPCVICGKDSRSQHFGKPENMCYSCFSKGKEN